MTNKMAKWFFMRPGFETFRLDPQRHNRYVFGQYDRAVRDNLLQSLEESAYSNDGYKAAVYGDYGRGKTHQCHNIIHEVKRHNLRFVPVYVKCGAFRKKEPFATLFRQIVFGPTSEVIQNVATEYARRVAAGASQPITDFVQSEDVALVMSEGLAAVNIDAVKLSLRWLAGEPKVPLNLISSSLKPQLVESGDFGDAMRVLAHIFLTVLDKIPLYIVDEAERFENITDPDTYYGWLAAMRELTEIQEMAVIFMIGAKTRDVLPTIFVQDEIVRRIGVMNYVELVSPGREDLREFVLEQLQTAVLKGPVPEAQRELVAAEALESGIPNELIEATGNDPKRLETYPFEPAAFEGFIRQLVDGDMTNKPSEAQIRLQRAAQRAMRLGARTISETLVEELTAETF